MTSQSSLTQHPIKPSASRRKGLITHSPQVQIVETIDERRIRHCYREAVRELEACLRGEPYEFRPFDPDDPRDWTPRQFWK